MANAWVAAVARVLNGLFEPLALALGPRVYRIFRSVRWRVGKALAWHKVQPSVWRVAVEAEDDVKLRLVLRDKALNVLGEWTLCVEGVGVRCRCRVEGKALEIELPEIEEGALFSIYPEGGVVSGNIRFLENDLVCRRGVSPRQGDEATSCSDAARRRVYGIKCIAWDLDGVIWDGTLSEGEDVKLRSGVMETIKALDEVGIVSSICSKNDADVALAKLKELGIEEWFVFPQINWGPKSESLKNLAKEMNIGIDSIAFVDDREENREEVRANLPQVRVFDENEGVGSRGQGLGGRRRLMYREEMKRRGAAREFTGDSAAFAAASGLAFELLPVEGERIGRCRELVQRTNQLNLTARRYDEETFAELLEENECMAVRVWDKYGDYGIVGFIAKKGLHLVECCFSCRSAGRGIEWKVLAEVAKGRKLTADIAETERNAPIREIVKEFLV